MKTSTISEILKSKPINSTARRVMQLGYHYEHQVGNHHVRSAVPLPFIRGGRSSLSEGKTFGRLTVIGEVPREEIKGKDKELKLVVRCTCGYYEHRTHRSLMMNAPEDIMCSVCMIIERRRNKKNYLSRERSRSPFPTKRVLRPGTDVDLTGHRFGNFSVIGIADRVKKSKSNGQLWVVRCDCGWHEYRTAKALRNPSGCLMCEVCELEQRSPAQNSKP